jgi:hypothetical protein
MKRETIYCLQHCNNHTLALSLHMLLLLPHVSVLVVSDGWKGKFPSVFVCVRTRWCW